MNNINLRSGGKMEQCGDRLENMAAVGTVLDNSEFLPQLSQVFFVQPFPPFITLVVPLAGCVPASCYTCRNEAGDLGAEPIGWRACPSLSFLPFASFSTLLG